jgi:hypothetical protein
VFQICCTTKVLSELGLKPRDLAPRSSATAPLKTWYVNLFRYERRKCLAFINPSTHYALIAMNVVKKDILNLPQLLRDLLRKSFLAEGISSSVIEELLSDTQSEYFPTADRSARARLNLVIRELPYYANDFFGRPDINERLASICNDSPAVGGQSGLERLRLATGDTCRVTSRKLITDRSYEGQILPVKVSLLDSDPSVWRTLRVPASLNLHAFHHAIQGSMGWQNSHLHRFSCGLRQYEDMKAGGANGCKEERGANIAELFGSARVATYMYDFGDDWEHKLLIQSLDAGPGENLPSCIDGAGKCPPEDCGGVYGYQELLTVLKGPPSEHRTELLEWLGADYDPSAFSVDEANARMRAAVYRI